MDSVNERWLSSLKLPRQAAFLRHLVHFAEREPAVRFVELCCSVARGAGDDLSDLDLGLGIADDRWPDALATVGRAIRELGDVVAVLEHELPGWGEVPHRRYFAQYRDFVQIDLVAMPASRRTGIPAGSIALYDLDGQLAKVVTPPQAEAPAGAAHEWSFLAWVALMNLDKYLRRGSLWEAFEQVHEARGFVWRLWAIANHVPYPAFGLTAVLDEKELGPPPGLERSVSLLRDADLRPAGLRLASVLRTVSRAAAEGDESRLPLAMERFVIARLTSP